MSMLANYIKMDIYKFLKSHILLSHCYIPLLGLVLMLGYFKLSNHPEIEKMYIYAEVIAMAYPFAISLITTMIYEQEENNQFYYLLTTPTEKCTPHLSKVVLLLIFGLGSTLIAFVGFGLIINSAFELSSCFKLSIITWGVNIPIYMIQYLVVFSVGKGASLGCGIVGSLITALMMTGIGDTAWFLNPWGCVIRIPFYFLQINSQNLIDKGVQWQLQWALCCMGIYIVVALIGIITFSHRWEGRKELN